MITGFEPFGKDSVNPTQLLLERLPDELDGAKLHKLLLPVEFGRAAKIACSEYERIKPGAVICFGQAGGRKAVTPELLAYNLMDARIPDNAGESPVNEPIRNGGAETIETRLPVWSMIARIRSLGLPAEISYSAGRYVCNALMYGVLSCIPADIPAGFIHVPFIREQVEGTPGREGKPFMELDDIVKAAKAAVRALIHS